jgi:hypothetical protein
VVRRRAEAEIAPAAVRDDAFVEEPTTELLGALRLEGEEPAEGLERDVALPRDVVERESVEALGEKRRLRPCSSKKSKTRAAR